MVTIRKPTLEEWFQDYQLAFISKSYTHFPGFLEIDITALVDWSKEKGIRLSPTALVVKAAGLLLKKRPRLNRVVFRTLFGTKIAYLDDINVNLPVQVHHEGKPSLSGMVLKNVDIKPLQDLKDEIRSFAQSDLSDKPIGLFVHRRKNNSYNRLVLKILHILAYRTPKLYLKHGGGGISVTSMMHRDFPLLLARVAAYGNTIITFAVTGLKKNSSNQDILQVGVGFNHSTVPGDEFQDALVQFTEILSTTPPAELFGEISESES